MNKPNNTIENLFAMQEKNKKPALIIGVVFALIIAAVFISDGISERKSKGNSLKIEDLIEQGDFIEAKKLAKSSEFGGDEMLTKVVKAQVSTLVDRGDLSLASDVAKEDGRYSIYFDVLLERLVPLYESNKQGLFMALAQLNFPALGNASNWDGDKYHTIDQWKLNSLYTSYNNSLSQLMSYAKTNNDQDSIKKLASFLKPLYKSNKVKKDPSPSYPNGHEETVWDQTPTDYTQANQIKKELGIK